MIVLQNKTAPNVRGGFEVLTVDLVGAAGIFERFLDLAEVE